MNLSRKWLNEFVQICKRAQHSVGGLPTELSGVDLLASGKRGAVQRHGDQIFFFYVLGPSDNPVNGSMNLYKYQLLIRTLRKL